jgi:hypothetical protein
MQGEHFVVTSSCHFANAVFNERTTFSYSVRLVVYGMAFPFLMRSVVLSRRRGGRDLVRDHRRQAYLMARGPQVGGRRIALSEWGHKHSAGLRSLVELKHSGLAMACSKSLCDSCVSLVYTLTSVTSFFPNSLTAILHAPLLPRLEKKYALDSQLYKEINNK